MSHIDAATVGRSPAIALQLHKGDNDQETTHRALRGMDIPGDGGVSRGSSGSGGAGGGGGSSIGGSQLPMKGNTIHTINPYHTSLLVICRCT